ncbi:unnamed protein product [Ilex paraguariensis]|uniref:Uncharacterized protein n=1 Tax=Ilex paraguariensis TaxID=185542 RepID=A0ABC8QUL6_9AQUA
MSTERVLVAKLKEQQARKAWEAASKAVKDEEEIKQKLCEDLNSLVQESSSAQFARLKELKRRLEALNPSRSYTSAPYDGNLMGPAKSGATLDASSIPATLEPTGELAGKVFSQGNGEIRSIMNGTSQQSSVDGEGRGKKEEGRRKF